MRRHMLCTVSTVKDSRANVERFVERNLAAGTDHMFILLEADDDGLLEALDAQPHVTAALTNDAYWHGSRPTNLNVRQRANAELVNTLLSFFPDVEWLFHLDGDEVLDLDRARLLELPRDVRCVNLSPLEAVSKHHWEGEVDRFKRLLTDEELALLTALGALNSPQNGRYFRGHQQGKPGVRPALDLCLGDSVHWVTDRFRETPDHHVARDLRMLHYESYDAVEFVRKWEAHSSSGGAGFRRQKRIVDSAVAAVQRNAALDPEQRRKYLERIFERRVADPVDLLDELGLLVTPDPAWHQHVPQRFPAAEATLMASLWAQLRSVRKEPFVTDEPDAVRNLLLRVREEIATSEPALAERIDDTLPPPFAADEAGLEPEAANADRRTSVGRRIARRVLDRSRETR